MELSKVAEVIANTKGTLETLLKKEQEYMDKTRPRKQPLIWKTLSIVLKKPNLPLKQVPTNP
jgi:hypothetical protein